MYWSDTPCEQSISYKYLHILGIIAGIILIICGICFYNYELVREPYGWFRGEKGEMVWAVDDVEGWRESRKQEVIQHSGMPVLFGASFSLINAYMLYSKKKKIQSDYKFYSINIDKNKKMARKRVEVLLADIAIINQANQANEGYLTELYKYEVIPAKYRNLEACSMFLQYIESGRTSSIRSRLGDPGAVNLYEEDLKHRRVMKKLDDIQRTQYYLCREISKINAKVDSLTAETKRSLKVLERNSEIQTYCSMIQTQDIRQIRNTLTELY